MEKLPALPARGGAIELTPQGKHLRFIINLPGVRAAGLEISPNLLRLAEVIQPE